MLTLIISHKSNNGLLDTTVMMQALSGNVPLFAGYDPVLSNLSLDRYSTDTHGLLREKIRKLDIQKVDACAIVLVLCAPEELTSHERKLLGIASEQGKTISYQAKAHESL